MQGRLKKYEHELINELIDGGYLMSPRIIEAFESVRRYDFVREEDMADSSQNSPLPIGFGQTISQPLTVAFMLELLDPRSGDVILDIGCGSGWTTALLAKITGPRGRVYGLEIVGRLADFASANVSKYNFINKGIATIIKGDGKKGLPQAAPFDRILVSAAAQKLPPLLVKQLRPGGCLVAPIGKNGSSQDLAVIKKDEAGKIKERRIPGFIFVPLV